MASTLPRLNRCSSSSISAADLLNLLSPESKNGFLRQRTVTKFIKAVKWRHRFVVLAQNALYVYENEMSRSPETSIPLLGYIAVKRDKSPTCTWVFALVPGVPSLTPRVFACSNDADRKDWMRRIKRNLYSANNVRPAKNPTQYKGTENLTPEDEEYLELELPVKSFPGTTSDDGETTENQEDEESSSDDNVEEKEIETARKGSSRSIFSLPTTHQNDKELDNPPRYSAIVNEEEYHYENLASTPKAIELGLEKACTIVDESVNRDREKCIEMLKATKMVGTYLIRKSRNEDYRVLAVLSTENVVKEFKIEEDYGMFHFHTDKKHEFPTIDALLAYYTTYKKIPNLQSFLVWGIHECVDDKSYEPVDELWNS